MADTAWTTIRTEDEEFKPGDSVQGLDDNTMQQLRDAGSVRDADYPTDVQPNESVRERNIRVLSEKMDEIQAAGFDMSDVELAPTDWSSIPASSEEAEVDASTSGKKTTAKASSSSGGNGS